CETDVLNTFLVFQRFQLMRGVLDRAHYDAEIAFVREWLASQPGDHWKEYLAAWKTA
ncbi:MAG TPA: 3'-5' exonuclease, partial [Nitrosomonas europaea]|nr:3'-5' exonuclease [Nitrosomonas europaea]